MKILFETVKILLLSVIALLLAANMGLVTLSPWVDFVARFGGGFEGTGLGNNAVTESSVADGSKEAGDAPTEPTQLPVTNDVAEGTILVPTISEEGTTKHSNGAEALAAVGPLESDPQAKSVENQWPKDLPPDEHDLQIILENRLASRYDFPDHVKFQNTHFIVQRLFNDAGVEVEPDSEVEFAIYCGDYSAPNAAALYGPYRPFYAEILVNHADRSIDGEFWIDVDGEIKKSISFRSDLLISSRQESFDRRFKKYCGPREGFLVGEYRDYKIGQLAPYYRENFDKMASDIAKPDAAKKLAECTQSNANLKECYRRQVEKHRQ
jgi:hypothetical protein